MLTKKQEKYIRGLAQRIKATNQIGKNDITETVIDTIAYSLDAKELIKVHLLPNAMISRKDAVEILKDALPVEYIYTIGNQIVLYKTSSDEEKREVSTLVNKVK